MRTRVFYEKSAKSKYFNKLYSAILIAGGGTFGDGLTSMCSPTARLGR